MMHAQLDSLFEAIDGAKRLLILPHNDPDPDAIASAVALRYLLAEKWGIEGYIAYKGIIGRAEDKALMRYLGHPLHRLTGSDLRQSVPIALVDTQPGAGNNTLPSESPFYLQPSIDVEVLVEIERAQVPVEYFRRLVSTLQTAQIYDNVIISYVGSMNRPDLASEMADLLLRLEGIEWVICMGTYKGNLILAVRTRSRRGGGTRAGDCRRSRIGRGTRHNGGRSSSTGTGSSRGVGSTTRQTRVAASQDRTANGG